MFHYRTLPSSASSDGSGYGYSDKVNALVFYYYKAHVPKIMSTGPTSRMLIGKSHVLIVCPHRQQYIMYVFDYAFQF